VAPERPERPVAAESTAEAPERPGRHRKRKIGAALVLVVALVAGALVMLNRGGPGYDLDATLRSTASRVAPVWEDAGRASTLAQLHAVGAGAAEASTTLSGYRTDLVEVRNDDDRRAAEAAIDAHLGSLEALSAAAALDAATVADWPDVAAEVEGSTAALVAAEKTLLDRDLPGSPDLADVVTDVSGKLDVAITSITDKLKGWTAEVQTIEADKAAQQQKLDGYVTTFRAQTERYAGLRSSLSEFADRLENGRGTTYSISYGEFGAAAAQRREVHSAMSALVPPTDLVPAHTAILIAVQDSAAAVQAGTRGIEQYQFDYCYYNCYYTIEATPGWQEFSRKSDQADAAFTGGVGSWDAAVAAEQARIAGITTPARPAV
jgi:hypothetical protein